MVVTAKDLRLKTSRILKEVERTGSVTVTFRGKPVAKLVSLRAVGKESALDQAIGMWAGREDMKDVPAWVQKNRTPRYLR